MSSTCTRGSLGLGLLILLLWSQHDHCPKFSKLCTGAAFFPSLVSQIGWLFHSFRDAGGGDLQENIARQEALECQAGETWDHPSPLRAPPRLSPSSGSWAAGLQASLSCSIQEMRAGLGPGNPGREQGSQCWPEKLPWEDGIPRQGEGTSSEFGLNSDGVCSASA